VAVVALSRPASSLAFQPSAAYGPAMIRLYQAGSLTEAQLLVDQLRQSGIETYIVNEHLQGALGELPLSLLPEVCLLRDTDWERAQTLARKFEADNQSKVLGSVSCQMCDEESPSNFELCWKCRHPLPELADAQL
jgi:putative signal transducing protein